MLRRNPYAAWLLVVLASVALAASAQTVLPVAPHVQALERCNRMVVARPAEAEAAAREALAATAITPDQRLSATACMAVAQLLSAQGEAGVATLDRALALLDAPGVTPIGRLDGQMRLASMLVRVGRVDDALAMQEQVLATARERGIVPMQVESLRFMAAIRATEFDDPQGALPYFRQAYELHRVLAGTTGKPHPPLSYDLGYTLMQLGQYDEADAMFAEASAAAAAIPELAGMDDRIASHRAEILRQRGDAAEAEPRLAAALARQRAGGDLAGKVETLRRLARARLDLGRAEEALAPAHESLAVAESGGFTAEVRDALNTLADIHAALGRHAEALDYAARARETGRSLDRDAAARRLAGMQAVASRQLAPDEVAGRIAGDRNALLRNIAIAVLAAMAAGSLALLVRSRRRQRGLDALSATDPLTQLPNRRGLTRRIEALDLSGDRRAALLLVDVDHFKAINERFGYEGGDRALVEVARCLREACDAGDLVARWGGEEFLVLREDTSREAAFALAGHLRAQVERLQLEMAVGERSPLTVSIGVASLPLFPGGYDWHDALRAADRALYAAKRAGRNAWVGVHGVAEGIDADSALADVQAALAQGWLEVGGNRPMDWSGVGMGAEVDADAGAARSGTSS